MFGIRRQNSFSAVSPNPAAWDVDPDEPASPPKRRPSFHASTDLQRDRDGLEGAESEEDMRETIAELRQNLMTHATSSAETMEHFSSLQRAHDTLYKEHVHLQEQMDDAVELLKYLKEEKGAYEDKISELKVLLDDMRGDVDAGDAGGVVSVTIATLTKEKMEVEALLKEQRSREREALKRAAEVEGARAEMQTKVESLAKVKEAYDLQTKQQLENNMKLMELQKERGELLEKIRGLERGGGGQTSNDNDAIFDEMAKQLKEDKDTIGKLRGENDALSAEQTALKEQLDEAFQRRLESLKEQLEGGFEREREDMARKLNAAREEMEGYQCQVEVLQKQQSQQSEEGDNSGHNELMLENESLKYKLQEAEEKMEAMKDATAQRGEAHAQLEKEMQERLAKRIAAQLHEQKIAMEAQVREELEAEYRAGATSAEAQELEDQLRAQLGQMKDERERWRMEQEDINAKVAESQQQFAMVREGFKKKLDKEKAYSKELQLDIEAKEEVISKLSEECQEVVQELEDLREKMSDSMSRTLWEEERDSLLRQHQDQSEENADRLRKLQREVDELFGEQTSHENEHQRWEEEKRSLEQRREEKDEELQQAMEDLEHLNGENAEYLRRIEECEERVGLMKGQADECDDVKGKLEESREQNEALAGQMETLASEKGELEQSAMDLSKDLDSMRDERDKLQESLKETCQLVQEMEEKQTSYKREKEQVLGEHQSTIQELESQVAEMEAASKSTELAVSEKEKALSDMAQMESKHQEVIAGLQAHVSDSTSQVTKLIDQLSAESSEKAALSTKLVSATVDLSAMKEKAETQASKIAQLESSIESITAERDAKHEQVTKLLSISADKEKLELSSHESIATIKQLETEKAEAIAKASGMEDSIAELKSKTESLAGELTASKSEVRNLESRLEALTTENEALHEENEGVDSVEDHTAEVEALQSEIQELKEANAQLKTDNSALTESMLATPSSADASNDANAELTKVKDELQKLKDEMNDTKDNSVALQEAVQDIQVEKEDLELENEELASKLTDLTTQAKKMLLNNESLEEDIQDQQIEYEDRIAELEQDLAELAGKDDNDAFASLRQKHKAALSTIVKLKSEIDDLDSKDEREANDGGDETAERLKDVEEENLELRQVVNHLTSENTAAKEIKFIVLELRAKNTELVEANRVAEEQNQLAVDVIENLKAEKEKLEREVLDVQNDEMKGKVISVPINSAENSANEAADKLGEMEEELRRYKEMCSQLSSERNVFNKRLTELMGISEPSEPTANEGALVPIDANNTSPDADQGLTNTQIVVADPHLADGVEAQIRSLTIENGQLAQKLGGAVAEKEYAMTTLSKLGAKLEELMDRNKLLSDIADVKSHHASSRTSYCSGGGSAASRSFFSKGPEQKPKARGLDPDASSIAENGSSYSSYYDDGAPTTDDPSAYSQSASTIGTSIISYETNKLKQLEPESASVIDAIAEEPSVFSDKTPGDRNGMHRRQASDPSDAPTTCPGSRQIKVTGGVYRGETNARGQKHGEGRMKYDNGNIYQGQWKNNKRDGKGTTQYASGNVYNGAWKAGKRHGFGVFHIKKTGDIYRGNWAQGLKNGAGVYEYADGELDVSYYQEDKRVGEGVRWSADRRKASRLSDGQLVGEEGQMRLDDAMRLTKGLGFVV